MGKVTGQQQGEQRNDGWTGHPHWQPKRAAGRHSRPPAFLDLGWLVTAFGK